MLDLALFDPVELYRIACGDDAIGQLKIVRESELQSTPFDVPSKDIVIVWEGETGAIRLIQSKNNDQRGESGLISNALHLVSIPPTDADITNGDFVFLTRKANSLRIKGVIDAVDRKLSRIVLQVDESRNVPLDFADVGLDA